MPLFASNKAQTQNVDGSIKRTFQQIERSSRSQWNEINLATGWAEATKCQWRVDFNGFIHLRGLAQMTGTVANGASSTVANLIPAGTTPPFGNRITPIFNELFVGWGMGPAGLIAVNTNGTIVATNNTGGLLTNPLCSLSGITYDTVL